MISSMTLKRIKITNIRNLSQADLTPVSRVNILYGANGSGKTSVLEAIHFLATTRSFRTSQFRHLLSQGAQQALVFARIDPFSEQRLSALGVERDDQGNVKARYDGRTLDSAELASLLPVQVIHSGTFELLDGSPTVRRQFLDWGCFHSESAFITRWRSFKRALKQRNSLLKYGKIDPIQMQVWNREFVEQGQALTDLRDRYLQALIPEFEQILSVLLGDVPIRLGFSAGWDRKRALADMLDENFARDLQHGFTQLGPQRADLRFRLEQKNAADILSRGQKKLVVSALKLAQGSLYRRYSNRPCIYLFDDLPSELDDKHCRLFCDFISQSLDQCFITCVDPDTMTQFWASDIDLSLFHLDSGRLSHKVALGD